MYYCAVDYAVGTFECGRYLWLAGDNETQYRPRIFPVDTPFAGVAGVAGDAGGILLDLYKRDRSPLASLFLSAHECKLINQRACAYLIRDVLALGNGYIPLVVGNLLPILVLAEQ